MTSICNWRLNATHLKVGYGPQRLDVVTVTQGLLKNALAFVESCDLLCTGGHVRRSPAPAFNAVSQP